MKLATLITITCGILIASLAVAADMPAENVLAAPSAATMPEATPATAPDASAATRPESFTVRGQVKAAANLEFQSIDLASVVVYLSSDPALDAVAAKPGRAVVAQRNKAFVPRFLIIPKDTVVEFPNWDHISHNVFSRSAAAPAFDLDRYPYGQSKSRQFTKVGVVQLFCNIHPTMRALIFVTPSSFFARADKDGNFEIKNVPVGHYQIFAWQERCKTQQQDVEVGPDAHAVAFMIDEDRGSILENDPPRHGDNYGVERGLGIKRERLNLPVVQDSHPAPTTEPCDNCN